MLPQFKNFTNDAEARAIMQQCEELLPTLLTHHLHEAHTIKILHDEPEVWRIWWQLGEIRFCRHRIFPCTGDTTCFFHPHPWPSIIKITKGGYLHRTAQYNGAKNYVAKLQPDDIEAFSREMVPLETILTPGAIYSQTDIRQFHQVIVSDVSESFMVMGLPYFKGATKQFSRVIPQGQNISLKDAEFDSMVLSMKNEISMM